MVLMMLIIILLVAEFTKKHLVIIWHPGEIQVFSSIIEK